MLKLFSDDTKVSSNLKSRRKYIVLVLIITIIFIGGLFYTNANKHLNINIGVTKSNTYIIDIKGNKKYYQISNLNVDINNKYIKAIELNNVNNKITINNKSKNKILDIKILDSKNNKLVDKIDSVYPDTLWEVSLKNGNYKIFIKNNDYVK